MSATAFQRMRREQAAKQQAEAPGIKGPAKAEIMARLDEIGVEYDKKANKAVLAALLEAPLEDKGKSGPDEKGNLQSGNSDSGADALDNDSEGNKEGSDLDTKNNNEDAE